MKMTFKEYLTESTIMSRDALKQAMGDYPQRQIGKTDGSKPKSKRLDQMDKRKDRKAGHRSEEEEVAKKRRKAVFFKPDAMDDNKPIKNKRGRPKLPAMLRKQSGL